MTVSIVRQRLLRTGDTEFSATTASDVDQYLVVVSERINKIEMAELWVQTAGNPIPKNSIKQYGDNFVLCDRIRCSAEANQSLLWRVYVYWKEFEDADNQPLQNNSPSPFQGDGPVSVDPEDWAPSWQRRTIIVFEPAKEAYYRGGYRPSVAALFGSDYQLAVPERKCPLVNSALQPFVDTPEHRRRFYVWTFKWLRLSVPEDLLAAEGKLNSEDWQLTRGIEQLWPAETALIDSVNLNEVRHGTKKYAEITVEIIQDPAGMRWKLADRGTAARAFPGDDDENGNPISFPPGSNKPQHRQLVDANGRAIQDPVFLDGNGQPLRDYEDIVYIEFLDHEVVDFASVVLFDDLGEPV
jgi:hypothetical protein